MCNYIFLFVYKICYLNRKNTERLKNEMLQTSLFKSTRPELEVKPRKVSEHIIKQLKTTGVKTV
jgi:hypothetical protein